MTRAGLVVGALLASACTNSNSKRCGDFVCPDTSVCAPSGDRCATQAQIEVCRDAADGSTCSFPGTDVGVCDREVCIAGGCGNGIVETASDEVCDDGNRISGDGCRSDCKSSETCGDGIEDPTVGEHCDCGTTGNPAFGCGQLNSMNPGATCRLDCTPARCGDDVIDPHEACDDHNVVPGDGCRADCLGRWTRMPTTVLVKLDDVWAASLDDAWAVGESKVLHFDSVRWVDQSPPDPEPVYISVYGTPTQGVFVVNESYSQVTSKIWRYAGNAWTDVTPPGGAIRWRSIHADGDTVWIGGSYGGASPPYGRVAKWNASSTQFDIDPADANLDTGPNDLFVTSTGLVWAIDSNGKLKIRATNGTWADETAVPNARKLTGSGPSDVTVFTSLPKAFHYNGGGWSELANGGDLYVDGAAGGGGVSIAVSGQGGVMICTATGCVGSPNEATQDLFGAFVLDDKHAFLVGALGTILF